MARRPSVAHFNYPIKLFVLLPNNIVCNGCKKSAFWFVSSRVELKLAKMCTFVTATMVVLICLTVLACTIHPRAAHSILLFNASAFLVLIWLFFNSQHVEEKFCPLFNLIVTNFVSSPYEYGLWFSFTLIVLAVSDLVEEFYDLWVLASFIIGAFNCLHIVATAIRLVWFKVCCPITLLRLPLCVWCRTTCQLGLCSVTHPFIQSQCVSNSRTFMQVLVCQFHLQSTVSIIVVAISLLVITYSSLYRTGGTSAEPPQRKGTKITDRQANNPPYIIHVPEDTSSFHSLL